MSRVPKLFEILRWHAYKVVVVVGVVRFHFREVFAYRQGRIQAICAAYVRGREIDGKGTRFFTGPALDGSVLRGKGIHHFFVHFFVHCEQVCRKKDLLLDGGVWGAHLCTVLLIHQWHRRLED